MRCRELPDWNLESPLVSFGIVTNVQYERKISQSGSATGGVDVRRVPGPPDVP